MRRHVYGSNCKHERRGVSEVHGLEKERDYYEKELVKETDKREFMAKKTTWAIEKDPKRPGKVKIVDQEHAAELLELANDYLS